MKRIIPASAAIILLIAGAGSAEAQQWQGGQGGQRQAQNDQAGRLGGLPGQLQRQQQQRQQQQAQPPQQPAQQAPQAQPQAQAPQQQQFQGEGGPRGVRVGEPNGRGGGWNNQRDGRRDRGDRGGWNNNDRGGDRGGRGWNNGGQRHQAGRYYAPRGYSLRIWSYGQILPGAYWGSSYVIRDYWRFGLPRPYAGCEWIRSGDDALMIDRRGRVIEVARNLFW